MARLATAETPARRAHPRSVLCLPILRHSELIGLLYLENNVLPGAFTAKRLAVLEIIASQAAIALENAGLFAELQRTAITDSLTGAYNTRFFHEVLGRETARAERYTTPLSLLMIDIDSFKVVNDTFGHVVGNKVLTQIANTLKQSIRNTDFVFRCGGDEFGVVLPGTNMEGADFANCDLREADFHQANLQRANFIGACLNGADG